MTAKSKKIQPCFTALRSFLFLILFLVLSSFGIQENHYAIKKVVIDAGHGGYDSGCLGSKTKEKDVALAISLKLGRYIEDHFPDVKVIYTRKTDVFIELHQRAEIANNAKADLFICIHCNSACYRDKKKKKDICNEESFGIETWVMGLHVAGENLEVAKRENDVVLLEQGYEKKYDGFDPNSPESNIIFSLFQNTFLEQSLKLASFVGEEAKKKGRESRGVKQAGFLVLYKTYMPSVLVETGFLTNPAEEKYLSSEKGQDAVAHTIFNAFKSYKSSIESSDAKSRKNGKDSSFENAEKKEKDSSIKVLVPAVKTDSTASIILNPDSTPDDLKMKTEKADTIKFKADISRKGTMTDVEYIFSVQILLSVTHLKPTDAKFKGVRDINEERDGKFLKYTTGKFKTFEEAEKLLSNMRSKGFKDAFIVAYKNGKRMAAQQAREEMKK